MYFVRGRISSRIIYRSTYKSNRHLLFVCTEIEMARDQLSFFADRRGYNRQRGKSPSSKSSSPKSPPPKSPATMRRHPGNNNGLLKPKQSDLDSVEKRELQSSAVHNMLPDVTFSADGQIEAGLYPVTFRQAPCVINNTRRASVFLRYGPAEWKPAWKPVSYDNFFLPDVTYRPSCLGGRFHSDIDLIRADKLGPTT